MAGKKISAISGSVVRGTNGTLTITIDMQMNPAVATSYTAVSGTPPTVTPTSVSGSGALRTVIVITPDTPVTEAAAVTERFTQVPSE